MAESTAAEITPQAKSVVADEKEVPSKPRPIPTLEQDLEPSMEELQRESLKKKQLQLTDEVNELRTRLFLKEKELTSVKTELGITPFTEMRDNLNYSLRSVNDKWQQVKESERYKKTGETLTKWRENVTTSDTYKKTMDTLSTSGEKASSGMQVAGNRTTDAFKKAGDAIKENESLQNAWGRVRSATINFRENLTKPGNTAEQQQGGRPEQEAVVPDEPTQ
ncbi:Tumor protein D54 isoform X3 [Oopsacas minuta]|uniref:Tumor protein D54 isoform X3 n=1 Tax=Oopsacas minuta TaxID=111878 RepID=A0AAV7JD31_9METZ|nr:Tumor protein D54 isoform X3 [Oopsacas minuta]